MSTAACTLPARSEQASAAIDYLALTAIKGLGDDGIAHVLAQVYRDAGAIRDFFQSTPEQLRCHYGLREIVARSLAGQVERAMEKAAELLARANELGIVVLAPGHAEYPAGLHEFYDDEPPLLYAVGNLGLLSTQCVALVNSAKPTAAALDHTFGLASRLAEAGQTLLAGAESPSYNVVGLAAKRAGGTAITVMHNGLFTALKSGSQCEPALLVRLVAEHFDERRSLLISPFRLDGRWQKGNGPRRDRLLVALAQRIVAVQVKSGGTIERLCRHAIRLSRPVLACQVVATTKALAPNESLLPKGAVPLVADPAGSNVDQVLAASGQRDSQERLQDDDLERRRSLGQFFTPPEVARFIWAMAELLRGQKWSRTARVIDPACGEGVFLRVAIEHGQLPENCFGVDIDESLIPVWQQDEQLRGTRLFRTNGLLDNSTIGLHPASFDFVIGNPPFSGQGLKDILRLTEPLSGNSVQRERTLFGDEQDEPLPESAQDGSATIARYQRAILDYVARQLSRYMCWRLRDETDSVDAEPEDACNGGGLFADLDLPSEQPVRISDYERMAQAVVAWPADRLLDTTQPAVRDAVRRIASTAIEVFFTERFVQLAKPGGIVAIIVPESILASDQLALLRNWLMQQIQLLAVVSLPQKVFTGVGAKAKTGIVFARRYTVVEQEANATTDVTSRRLDLTPELLHKKVLMIAPKMELPNGTLHDYLNEVLEHTARHTKSANRKGATT